MKVIKITIDEALLEELDNVAASDGKARSALVRDAVRRMLRKRMFAEMDRRTIESYRKEPQDLAEAEEWEAIQDWGEE